MNNNENEFLQKVALLVEVFPDLDAKAVESIVATVGASESVDWIVDYIQFSKFELKKEAKNHHHLHHIIEEMKKEPAVTTAEEEEEGEEDEDEDEAAPSTTVNKETQTRSHMVKHGKGRGESHGKLKVQAAVKYGAAAKQNSVH